MDQCGFGSERGEAMIRTTVLFSLVFYLSGQTGVHSGIFNTGPYDLKLIRHELCEDQGTGEGTGDFYLVKKSTRKTFLHGTAVAPFDYDDTIQEETHFSKRGSRGWGSNAYILRSKHFCSDFQTNYPTLFEFFFKAWGIENPSCPIKAGNYTMDMDTDFPRLTKLPLLPYGTYKIVHVLSYGKPPVRFVCNIWYVACTERPR